ncbi:hypothetical protein ALC60_05879 [Trachymyrmex zeteki]|uniref:Uncharacterized protein n=1 Tax=Mycetomoellerius zeteki TaxID=64791 RepID=A0A151X4N9_9HYME|nr:PREDICTED: uncharacterized protein LOC108723004 [Trachymyrmex zeteki]XP_018303943.1 PREDICTED: uncharacterized protein LOC108723004 [Trachymyrmex zeteki]KYQ55254.1 hypothetical protein ALC60_05879 [Trachymyrmex zeteki]
MKLLIMCALTTVAFAAPGPGLLKVPRVYNAVITSNQNLSPSRAFPVIQPVIHRTAIGYVPPFYYTQIAPHFAGPEVVHYPLLADSKVIRNDQAQASSSKSHLAESMSFGFAKEDPAITDRAKENNSKNGDTKNSAKKNEQEPLTFYPNYRSLYYEPYIYTYNGFNPHLVPGTYYIDYRPYESVKPVRATTPRNVDSDLLLPSFHDEKRTHTKNDREKIPDVPPPPLPTSIPKRS